MGIITQLLTPRDCALAVGLPCSEEEFLNGFTESAGKDLAQSIRRRYRGLSPLMCWREIYEPIARLLADVAAEAAALGVTVCPQTTLASLGQLYEKSAVVTLLAHWRFNPLTADDIVDGNTLQRALANPTSELTEEIAQQLARQPTPPATPGRLGTANDDLRLRQQLAARLNDLLAPDTLHYEQGHHAPAGPPQTPRVHFSRALLEECFPEHIRAYPAIELSDRMYPVADFVAAVPTDYTGLLDLSVCNSIVIAEAIKRQRRGCMVLSNVYPARLVLRLLRYRYIIRILSKRPTTYPHALLQLNNALP